MSEKILAALKSLDPSKDAQWTEDGSPRIDVLKSLTGIFNLTRDQVTAAAPGFSRASLLADNTPGTPPVAPASAQTPPVATDPASPVADAAMQSPAETSSTPQPETSDEVSEAEQESEAGITEGLEAAKARLEHAESAKNAADKEFAQATKELDFWLAKSEKVSGTESLAMSLQGYFASQQKQRDIRASRMNQLKDVPLADILPKRAPIDQAFARKTERGTNRPK